MTNRQNIGSNWAAEIPPSKRVYAFSALPKELQKNLLRLQNTDGDFLKLSSGETERTVGLFALWMTMFIIFAAIVADSSLDLKRTVVFSADAIVLLLWFVYLVWKLFKTLSAPTKNRIYLTPTQVIETLDGTVRYRELKDASEIAVNVFSTDIGRRNKLDVKFDDGDFYQFYIPGMSNSKQLALMQKWQETATTWQRETVSALNRGNAAYLDTNDVLSGLAITNTPVLQRKFRTRKENLLLIVTIVLFSLNGAFIFFITK